MLLIVLAVLVSCDGEPLITELVENRLSIVLKGSYESDSVRPMILPGGANSSKAGSWVADITGNTDIPQRLFLDISELRADGDSFARYRTLSTVGLSDTEPFFNGAGIMLRNDDVRPDKAYSTIRLYLRKIGFDAGFNCDSTWNTTTPTEFFFGKGDVAGYDFNLKQIYRYGETSEDYDGDNLVFPMQIPISGTMNYDGDGEWVLEVRLVIKNNIARYADTASNISYWALDDRISAVAGGDGYIGGNIAAIAKAYKVGYTGSIDVSAAAGGSVVVAMPADEDIASFVSGKIPPYAIYRSAGSIIPNVPVGKAYNVYQASSDLGTLLGATPGYSQIGATVTINAPGETVTP